MNKSISAFIVGLIFSIIGAVVAYFFWVVFAIVGAFATGITQTLLTILPLVNLGTFALSLIGCIFCMIKSKVGGTILLISSLISIACITTSIVLTKTYDPKIFLFVIPSVFIFIASIIALKKKKVIA